MIGKSVVRYAVGELDTAQEFRKSFVRILRAAEPIDAIEKIYYAYFHATCAVLSLCSSSIQATIEKQGGNDRNIRIRRQSALNLFHRMFVGNTAEYKNLFPDELLSLYRRTYFFREQVAYHQHKTYAPLGEDEILEFAKMAEIYIDEVEDIVRFCTLQRRFPSSIQEINDDQMRRDDADEEAPAYER